MVEHESACHPEREAEPAPAHQALGPDIVGMVVGSSPAHAVLKLQRAIGNRSTRALLARQSTHARHRPARPAAVVVTIVSQEPMPAREFALRVQPARGLVAHTRGNPGR